jgi:hypothetical protein
MGNVTDSAAIAATAARAHRLNPDWKAAHKSVFSCKVGVLAAMVAYGVRTGVSKAPNPKTPTRERRKSTTMSYDKDMQRIRGKQGTGKQVYPSGRILST